MPRSNLMGTKFTVFDNALNPERALPDMSNARQELAGIIYVRIFFCLVVCFTHHPLLAPQFKNVTEFSPPSGNKCSRYERTEKDDSHHSRNEQGQWKSAAQTKKCKMNHTHSRMTNNSNLFTIFRKNKIQDFQKTDSD